MSVNVNPPPQLRIPQAFLQDREVRTFIEQQNTIIFQLYRRTGGVNDSIDDSQQNITSSSSRVSRNSAKINSLELKEFERIGDILITHGDVVNKEELKGAKVIVIGHEHPAVSITDDVRTELYKCYLNPSIPLFR